VNNKYINAFLENLTLIYLYVTQNGDEE